MTAALNIVQNSVYCLCILCIRCNVPRNIILPRPVVVSPTWTSNVYMTTVDYNEMPVAAALRCEGCVFTLKGWLLRWEFIYWNLSKLFVSRSFVRTPTHNSINHKWSTGGTTELTTVPMSCEIYEKTINTTMIFRWRREVLSF